MRLSRCLAGLLLMTAVAGCAQVSVTAGDPELAGSTPEPGARSAAEAGHLRTIGSRAVTLDPALIRDAGSAGYVLEIFAGLVKLNTELELTPDLAEEWEVSADGLVYTFHLRPEIKFAEGREITSADVVFSIERALSPEMESPLSVVYLGDIAGAMEYHQGDAASVSGLSMPDENTVRIELQSPSAMFLSKLTHPVSFVLDREEVDEFEWFKDPNESGPFKLLRWREREEVMLIRNDSYHRPALLEKVTIAIVGAGEGLLGYETGEIDIVPIGGRNVDRFRDSGERFSDDYRAAPQLSLYYVGFNTRVAPFDDVHVRRAFVLAIDMEKINRVTFRGHVQTANGILPTGLPGNDPERAVLGYDPDAARQELELSRYGGAENVPDVTFLISGTGLLPSQDTEAILYFLRENLGVTVRMLAVDFADLLLEVEDPDHQHQMVRYGWVADYPDPDNFLELLFLTDSPENLTHYSNPEVDALLGKARVESDPQRRYELYWDVEEIVIQDGVVLPMQFGMDHYLVRSYVRGFTVTSSLQEWMSTVWIDD